MSNSPILGGSKAPQQAPGTDVDRLGPSDSSDTGSDIQGERPMATSPDQPDEWGAIPSDADSDSDALGTGERASAAGSEPRDSADIMPDRIIGEDGDSGSAAVDADVQAALDSLADEAKAAGTDQERELVGETTSEAGSLPPGAGRHH